MKVAVVGAGYVGLVTGTCLADTGNDVVGLDIIPSKVASLSAGEIPIYEPGLTELVKRNIAAGRLRFTTDYAAAIPTADLVFLAVGTPQRANGSADLEAFWSAVAALAPHLGKQAIVVVKSTVPVGTNSRANARLAELTGRPCDVASNPEFLKEGAAINDFLYPDRVVVGVRRPEVAERLKELYKPFLRNEKPFLVMTPESSELTKYVANAMLSTKISFINEMANLCERLGGDINDVRRGIGHDRRIGFEFMFPGVGYGGSCFPKDVRALANLARLEGLEPRVLDAVDAVNQRQKLVLFQKMRDHFGGQLRGKPIAVWGLAFKPRTDDTREAPARELLDLLLEEGALPRVHDPEATPNIQRDYGPRLQYFARDMEALDGAEALAINTEWGEYRNPDFAEMRERMARPVIFDGRNLYEPAQMMAAGFTYHSIGRKTVWPAKP